MSTDNATADDGWLDDLEPGLDPCYSHVFLYRGYDLTAAGIYEHDIAACLLCSPLPLDREPYWP